MSAQVSWHLELRCPLALRGRLADVAVSAVSIHLELIDPNLCNTEPS